ncbi:MAG: hypothetical protein U9R37_02240 [Campylobacterota bacterium]|nr:hypothetical protein [Campylobacterota bacterium]
MGLKKYILGSILLILIIFGYTFSIEAGDYRIAIFDYIFVFPIALWIVLPVIFLFLFTILHILFYGMKNFFKLKAVTKDSESLVKLINNKLLDKELNLNFQNEDIKHIANILTQLDLTVTNSNFSSSNKEITKTVDCIFDIKSGKYISTKDLKLEDNTVPMIENIKNRIKKDENFALEVLKPNQGYNQEIVKDAFLRVLETKSITTIKKQLENLTFDNKMLIELFKKDSSSNIEFSMTNDDILRLIKKATLTNNELIDIANIYKTSMSPEQVIKLFEEISTFNEDFNSAYLYVLAQYEMVDKMRDILDNSATNEYVPFKALVDLKDSGKHFYSLDTLCYK